MKHAKLITSGVALVLLASCGTTPNDTSTSSGSDNLSSNTDYMAENSSGSVVLDLNHPLAGKTLNFEVEIMNIQKAEGNTQADIVEPGDSIEVHYTGTLDDGEKFDSSYDRNETLPFVVGAGQMISGFDSGVVGMKLWEKKDITIAPADGYGEYDPALTKTVPKSELGSFVNAGYKLEKGESLPTQFGNVMIIDVINE